MWSLIVASNTYRRKVNWFLTALVVLGVTLSGVVGALQAQSLHSECVSKTSRPEVECAPPDFGMIVLSGFYIVIFLTIALPLTLLVRYLLLKPPREKKICATDRNGMGRGKSDER